MGRMRSNQTAARAVTRGKQKAQSRSSTINSGGMFAGVGDVRITDPDENPRAMLYRATERMQSDISKGAFSGIETINDKDQDGDDLSPQFKRVHQIIDSHRFNVAINACIVLNAVQMGVETDHPQFEDVYKVTESFFTFVFSVEMFLKKYAYRCSYFKDGWNCLDFFLVWLSIIDGFILGIVLGGSGALQGLSILRILRLVRVVKMVRLLKAFKELWLIVKGLLDSIKTIFWASLLLIMMLYVFSIFLVQMVGTNTTVGYYRRIDEEHPGAEIDYHPDYDAYQFFGNIPRAMFTLFETALEPLNIRPIVERQPAIFPFLLLFIFLTTFGVMNVIIGVIVENTMQASKSTKSDLEAIEAIQRIATAEKMRDAVFLIDKNSDGVISAPELVAGIQDEQVAEYMQDIHFPTGFGEDEMFLLLDIHADGVISPQSMLKELLRTTVQNDRQHLMNLKLSIYKVRNRLRNEVFPVLNERGEGLTGRLNALAMQCKNTNETTCEEVEQILKSAYASLGGTNPVAPAA